jgi:hypothetical protein
MQVLNDIIKCLKFLKKSLNSEDLLLETDGLYKYNVICQNSEMKGRF